MLLHTLLRQLSSSISLEGVPNAPVTGIAEDSRRVEPGNIFIARGGTRTDGRRFVRDAQVNGAVAVVTPQPIDDSPLPQVVGDLSAAASVLANMFHGQPSHYMKVFGVTGTNGKTTTAFLIQHLLAKVNRRCGVMGTVIVDDGKARREADMTTPSAVEVAETLAKMRENRCEAAAVEVSSHALDQGRVAGVKFAAAGFTNLTGDHLDYHKTMDNYADAKARLFEMLSAEAAGIVNADDEASARMVRGCRGRIVSFGLGRVGDYRAEGISISAEGSSFMLQTPAGSARVRMQLIGRHNIANALTAAAMVGECYQFTAEQMAEALTDAAGAPGRLQAIRCGQPFGVFVDYAHTDDGLKNVLEALRPLARGKLRVLFGCGGDRDGTKRPRMAAVAEQLADAIYVTSDNPRSEDPRGIVEQVLSGLSATGRERAIVEVDRRAAIERIIEDAREGDIVLLAGKGHENYQIVGVEKRHFDDVEEAVRILSRAEPLAA